MRLEAHGLCALGWPPISGNRNRSERPDTEHVERWNCRMGRRTNYGYEKRQRELKKQKKREEKAERKRLKREAAAAQDLDETVEGADESEADLTT